MRPNLTTPLDSAGIERVLLPAVIALLVLALGWTAARFVGLFLDDARAPAAATADRDRDPSATERAFSLADYHLFGTSAGTVDGAVAVNAPETELDLTLHGTLAAADQDAALAIIADSSGNEKTYAVGDDLPGSARLYRVYADRVLLRTGEGIEALSLRPPDVAARPSAGPAGAARGGDIAVVTPPGKRDWGAMRRSLLADPARIAQTVSALPVQQNGELVGFRLRSGRDAALLGQLGLRQSDVITAVNGIALNDYGKAADILAELKTASQLNVTVLRNGQKEQIHISLEQ